MSLIKFPPKKLRAVKVEQLNFLSENLKRNFPTAASMPEVRHRIKPGYCRPCTSRFCVLVYLRFVTRGPERRAEISADIFARLLRYFRLSYKNLPIIVENTFFSLNEL